MGTWKISQPAPFPPEEEGAQGIEHPKPSRDLSGMPSSTGTSDEENEQHRMTLEALADVDAGRVVEHQIVKAWAMSLGSGDPPPPPL